MKNTQLKALPRASFVCKRFSSISIMLSQDVDFWLTQYIIGVHPSMVTHWKVVSMARPMLSKDVIPEIFRVLSPLLEPGGRKRIFTFIRPVPFLQTYWLIMPDIMICNNYYLISWSKFLSRLVASQTKLVQFVFFEWKLWNWHHMTNFTMALNQNGTLTRNWSICQVLTDTRSCLWERCVPFRWHKALPPPPQSGCCLGLIISLLSNG